MYRTPLLVGAAVALVGFLAHERVDASPPIGRAVIDPFIGQIMMFGGNFPPEGWAFCDGSLLAISSNQALFSILGTTYGGDGETTFALPNLQGRFALHPENQISPGSIALGDTGGSATVTLTEAQMPAHSHDVACRNDSNTTRRPMGAIPAGARTEVYSTDPPDSMMSPGTISIVGGGQAHDNMPPYLAVNYIIALQGVFPLE